jgi:hypothetical protein
MPGRVKALIDELLLVRTNGNEALVPFVRAHLILQGIDPNRYSPASPDDSKLEERLRQLIETFRQS